MLNPWGMFLGMLLLVSPIIGIGMYLAHLRFSARSIHVLSGSASLLMIWWLLSAGSLLLSAIVTVGGFVLAFHATEEVLVALASYILFGLFSLFAIPYFIHLANERVKVIDQRGGNHNPRTTVVLMLVSFIAFAAVWVQLLKLLPGLDIID